MRKLPLILLIFLLATLSRLTQANDAWAAYPETLPQYDYSGAKLKHHWDRLTTGINEPFPDVAYLKSMVNNHPELTNIITDTLNNTDSTNDQAIDPKTISDTEYQLYAAQLQDAWRALFEGRFQEAKQLGIALGPAGYIPALYAQCIYAQHLARTQQEKHNLLREVITLSNSLRGYQPVTHYVLFSNAYAKARIAEDLSLSEALATGYTRPMKSDLEQLMSLQPNHLFGAAALGGVHAGIIEKAGKLVARMTYGANEKIMRKWFEQAMNHNPLPPVIPLEYSIALNRLYGSKEADKIKQLLTKAKAIAPASAEESLEMTKVRAMLKTIEAGNNN
ncbi:MAG: hypothetical protein B0D91_02430 [Oceanospirillales bacterium LUC14_002_19_P2]|nr:MAG: hypothetical protein B0D91_02430 [Oceanospirillales bacterium LUC14_002_19_P2]